MGMQLREFGAWVRNRKILATLLVTVTLAVGMIIGTVISGHVGAAQFPDPDSIQEMRVETTGLNAQYATPATGSLKSHSLLFRWV